MAIAGPVENVARVSITSGTTSLPFLIAPGANIPVGTLMVIAWCGNVASVTVTCSDNSTQPGTANTYNAIAAAAASVMTGSLVWCMLTRQIQTTDTITLAFSGAGFTRCAARYMTFTGVDTASPLDKTATVNNLTASPCTMGPTAALAQTGSLGVSGSFWRDGVALSGAASTSGYTVTVTNSGGTTSRVDTGMAFKLNVGTAAETDVHTWSSAPTAGCGQIATFKAGTVVATKSRPPVVVQRVWSGR